MEISANEKLMYRAMKAIYDSGIPICFKGSLVLKAILIENDYGEQTRHTVDIDGNWISEAPPTAEAMSFSIQEALLKADLYLAVSPYRNYGPGRSAGFSFKDMMSGDSLFTMDIDVNRPVAETKIYEIEGISFSGIALSSILADKISVVSSNKIFRRIKDLMDIYYLSQIVKLDKEAILEASAKAGRQFENFESFLRRKDELLYAYGKFRLSGGVHKPPFDEVYDAVKAYLADFLPANV